VSKAPSVSVSVEEHVLIISIERPDVRNAVDGDVARRIAEAIDLLDSDDALRAGVLTGAGGTFCSGMDLKAFMIGDLPWVDGRGFGGLTQAPPSKPLIAAVEGWAVAGGFELMLACDLVVAADNARFGVPEVTRGLIAGGGAAMKLSQRIPRAIALEMLLTGRPISAQRALGLGLVNRVTEPGDALREAHDLASIIAANGPLAVAATKRVAQSAPGWSPRVEWEEQDAIAQPVYRSLDAGEGAAAFIERRKPLWRNK
jgi:enoyl-CoA hydratase